MAERYRPSANKNAAVLRIIKFLNGDAGDAKHTCPLCKKVALTVANGDKRPVKLWCFGDNTREHNLEVIDHLKSRGVWPGSDALRGEEASAAAEEKRTPEARRAYALRIWNALRGSEDMAQALLLPYFQGRGLKTVPAKARMILPIDAILEVGENDNRVASDDDAGMALPIYDKAGKLQAVQITWLNDDLSTKREKEPKRRTYGTLAGNFIDPDGMDLTQPIERLLIGEGVETVEAAKLLTGLPGIAAAGVVGKVEPPEAGTYILLVDNDADGKSRKHAGAFALRHLGRCQIAVAPRPEGSDKKGWDWNDLVIAYGESEDELVKLATAIREAPAFKDVMLESEKLTVRVDDLARLLLKQGLGVEYGKALNAAKIDLKIGNLAYLRADVEKRVEQIKADRAAAPQAKVDIKTLEDSAREIIDCENILERFQQSVSRIITGEQTNLKVLYLVAVSRLFGKKDTMHAGLKGTSAVGKSEVADAVIKYQPDEVVVKFHASSEKALLHCKEGFEHKILYLHEASGSNEHNQDFQERMLRQLMSDGRLEYFVATKGEGGGPPETVTVIKEGPVSTFITTTRTALHDENETRILSLDVDDSEKQTKAILLKIAEVKGLGKRINLEFLKPWHNFQRWLAAGPTDVVIPYAKPLAQLMHGTHSVRMRRDFGQIVAAIKSHALMHRAHREVDDEGSIIADIDHDYDIVAELLNALVDAQNEMSLKPKVRATVRAVKDLDNDDKGEDEKGAGVTAAAVGKRLHLDTGTARRRLQVALHAGALRNLEKYPRKGTEGRYRCQKLTQNDADASMPATEELKRAFAAWVDDDESEDRAKEA